MKRLHDSNPQEPHMLLTILVTYALLAAISYVMFVAFATAGGVR